MKHLLDLTKDEEPTPELKSEADREYEARIDAQRCTLEFQQKSTKSIDGGTASIEDSPLWGGNRQKGLF